MAIKFCMRRSKIITLERRSLMSQRQGFSTLFELAEHKPRLTFINTWVYKAFCGTGTIYFYRTILHPALIVHTTRCCGQLLFFTLCSLYKKVNVLIQKLLIKLCWNYLWAKKFRGIFQSKKVSISSTLYEQLLRPKA